MRNCPYCGSSDVDVVANADYAAMCLDCCSYMDLSGTWHVAGVTECPVCSTFGGADRALYIFNQHIHEEST